MVKINFFVSLNFITFTIKLKEWFFGSLMQQFEQWLTEPGAGANLLRAESQMLHAILDQRKSKNVLQIGGKALLNFSDHMKTHYVHQHEEMGFFSPGHSVCASHFHLPYRDASMSMVVCPHVHELCEEHEQDILMKQCARVLDDKGVLLLFGINLLGSWTLNRLVNHHSLKWAPRIHSIMQIETMARQAGLKLMKIQYFSITDYDLMMPIVDIKLDQMNATRRFSPCYMAILAHEHCELVWDNGYMLGG
jgi:hypothetical protein